MKSMHCKHQDQTKGGKMILATTVSVAHLQNLHITNYIIKLY